MSGVRVMPMSKSTLISSRRSLGVLSGLIFSATGILFHMVPGPVWADDAIAPLTLDLTEATKPESGAAPGVGTAAVEASGKDSSNRSKRTERYENLELFQRVLSVVEQNYVDTPENRELMYGAIKGMLETLDPHSNFLTPEVYRDMKVDTSGKFGGVGIEIGIKDEMLTVVSPIEDTPAWKAGVKAGDRLVKIDGESTRGLTLVEAVQKMRGKSGSDVRLTIWRPGLKEPKELKLTRGTVKIQSAKFETLENGFGYIRLTTFNENASSDIKASMAKIEKSGKLRGLVLDLRGNPGGLLDQAVEVTSLFVEDGVVVSTIGRNPEQKEVRSVRKGVARTDFPVAVLVSSNTASAAEIVAGALQDHHRALVLGQNTFGKGSVQTVMDLGQDLGLKLTIARYYTPNGRSIQEKGVVPDVELEDFDPKLLETARRKSDPVRERDLRGHIAGREQKETEKTSASPTSRSAYTAEELELASGRSKKSEAADAEESDGGSEQEFAPARFDPTKDYQVREALAYLKSFGAFRRLVEKEARDVEKKNLAAAKEGITDRKSASNVETLR
jgi:carboxyl-terminal processing protease